MPKLRNGHAPGHVRDTFLNAIEAFEAWRIGEPEPTVEYEVNYIPRQISLTEACGLVWNCNDILPGHYFAGMEEIGAKRQTYAAAAQAMHSFIANKPSGWRL
ncbi:MAG: hypothetical protein WAO08_06415 [Hyphomicrobiaceae bacterium]